MSKRNWWMRWEHINNFQQFFVLDLLEIFYTKEWRCFDFFL